MVVREHPVPGGPDDVDPERSGALEVLRGDLVAALGRADPLVEHLGVQLADLDDVGGHRDGPYASVAAR
jgi:hypothetical protein